MGWEIFYFSGIFVSIILILILAYYEKNIKGESIEDLPTALLLSLFSWVTVITFIIVYKKSYLNLFKK